MKMHLYQLINKQTKKIEKGPIPLPNDWGPIMGLDIMFKEGGLEKINNILADLEYYKHYEWEEVDVPMGVQTEEEIRITIKRLLESSDWTQLSDTPLNKVQQNLWQVYRRKLRAISKQAAFPRNIKWPDIPK